MNNSVIANVDWERILRGLLTITPFEVVKWFAVAGLVMYSFFAAVVIKQVGIMTETFESDVNSVVKLFAWMHLLVAIGLVVATIVWL